MKPATRWTRSFWGKHPAFRDYLRINADDRMLYAFIQWLDKGWINKSSSTREAGIEDSSCRFWIVPPDTFQLTCGMITASADSAGRPSPVLCTVKGTLPENPERDWDMITHYCRKTWRDMAGLLSGSFESLALFKEAFQEIALPDFNGRCACPDKKRMEVVREAVNTGLAAGRSRSIRDRMLHFTIPESIGGRDESVLWMAAVRQAIDVMPCSAFVRTDEGRKDIYLYYRPLAANDFRMMWNRK